MKVIVREGSFVNKIGELVEYAGYGLNNPISIVAIEHVGLKKIPTQYIEVMEDETNAEQEKQLTINVQGHSIQLYGEDAQRVAEFLNTVDPETFGPAFSCETNEGQIHEIQFDCISSTTRNFEI